MREAVGTQQGQPVQNRYEQMLASSATAAICAGPDDLILSWNTAAEELFGHSARAAIGQPLSIIIPVRHRDAHVAGLSRAVQAGKARLAGSSVDILALHADGSEVPVELSLSMWFEEGRPMFGALLRDITDRHNSRRHLEHLAHCDTPHLTAQSQCAARAAEHRYWGRGVLAAPARSRRLQAC